MSEDKMMVFSGGISAFVVLGITKQSPEGIAFTLPLNHPIAPDADENKINHFNLIRLHGISVGDENCYLINEYMENGSLKDWLCDKNCSSALSWMQRIQIAIDVANGLHCLHGFTEPEEEEVVVGKTTAKKKKGELLFYTSVGGRKKKVGQREMNVKS
ncbi:hypothetical protein ACLOJK_013292 [Asimina triloba]